MGAERPQVHHRGYLALEQHPTSRRKPLKHLWFSCLQSITWSVSDSFSQGLLPQVGSEMQTFYPGSRASGRPWACDLSPGHRCYSHGVKKVTEAGGGGGGFMGRAPCHAEAFLLVRSNVGGKGVDGAGQRFQSPHPSRCAHLRRWSSPEAAPSSPLSRQKRFNTCDRDGEQQITPSMLTFTRMDQRFNPPGGWWLRGERWATTRKTTATKKEKKEKQAQQKKNISLNVGWFCMLGLLSFILFRRL